MSKSNNLHGKILNRLYFLQSKKRAESIHEPFFDNSEINSILKCLKSGLVSTVDNNFVSNFEKSISNFTRIKFIHATNSGTSALHICLQTLGVGRNDEVIVPSLTFVATANVVLYCNAKPIFVDCERETLGVCPRNLNEFLEKNTFSKNNNLYNRQSKSKIKALIATHIYGMPNNIEELSSICKKYNLKLIEDATECLGTYFNNRHVGSFGDISALSFNGNKIITTAGGGAVMTNYKKYSNEAKLTINVSKEKKKGITYHSKLGFNYKMPGLNASLGLAQFKKINSFLKNKRKLANKYFKTFEDCSELKFFEEKKNTVSNYWIIAACLSKNVDKEKLIIKAKKKKIALQSIWVPLHKLKYFKSYQRTSMTNTNYIFNRLICFPSSPYLIK